MLSGALGLPLSPGSARVIIAWIGVAGVGLLAYAIHKKKMTLFVESAFKHGYDESDFYEILESSPLKLRSKRGLAGIFELYGRNFAGDYVHVAYRMEGERCTVFHMRRMTDRERQMYRKHR